MIHGMVDLATSQAWPSLGSGQDSSDGRAPSCAMNLLGDFGKSWWDQHSCILHEAVPLPSSLQRPSKEPACPYQFAASTRARAEALVRTLRTATELDPRATILSVDGVRAYDHVSRHATSDP